MTTVKGYLGWAPDNKFGDDEAQAKKGDLVAIIFGCSAPLVIRPKENVSRLLEKPIIKD
jgi:hypothetical protein